MQISSSDLMNGLVSSIEQTVARVLETRCITRGDQYRFMTAALTSRQLTDQEKAGINQIFDDLQRGFLRVID